MIAELDSSRVRVAVAGLGRSGWNIHGTTLAAMPDRFKIVAAVDAVRERRQEAEHLLGCWTSDRYESLLDDRSIDLIVVATPNHLHAAHAVAALGAGKHVVCEKPFALNLADADAMIAAANAAGRLLTPFQNRRYEPHFQKVQEIVRSGAIGRLVQIRLAWHTFSRRWDWQTLRRFGGGLLVNNGSHLLDHALQLLDGSAEPEVTADLQRVLSLGDTEDHVKILLRAPGGPTVDLELTSACAFPQDRWHIMGSAGGLRGTMDWLEWRTLDWREMPERRLDPAHATGRAYNSEVLPWQDHRWDKPADGPSEYTRFYLDLYESIRHGAPLTITAPSVRKLIATLERCYAQCPVADVQPVPTHGDSAHAAPLTTR